MRIIDADGSVYEGLLEAQAELAAKPAGSPSELNKAGTTAPAAQTRARDAAVEDRVALGDNGNYLFKAAGTNRTLNQMVVINGNLQNARITANALIGGTNQAMKIEAVSTPP